MKPFVIVEQFRLRDAPDRSRRCISGFSDLQSAERALPGIVRILRDPAVSAVEEPPRIVALADLAGRDRAEFLKLPHVHSFTAYYPNEPIAAPLEA